MNKMVKEENTPQYASRDAMRMVWQYVRGTVPEVDIALMKAIQAALDCGHKRETIIRCLQKNSEQPSKMLDSINTLRNLKLH